MAYGIPRKWPNVAPWWDSDRLLTPTPLVIWDAWKKNPRPFQGLGPESYTPMETKRTFGKTYRSQTLKVFCTFSELHEQNPNQIEKGLFGYKDQPKKCQDDFRKQAQLCHQKDMNHLPTRFAFFGVWANSLASFQGRLHLPKNYHENLKTTIWRRIS